MKENKKTTHLKIFRGLHEYKPKNAKDHQKLYKFHEITCLMLEPAVKYYNSDHYKPTSDFVHSPVSDCAGDFEAVLAYELNQVKNTIGYQKTFAALNAIYEVIKTLFFNLFIFLDQYVINLSREMFLPDHEIDRSLKKLINLGVFIKETRDSS